jgi:ribosome-binding factor A
VAKERRILRLQQLILEIAAEALQRERHDPRLELVSFTRVKLTSDLLSATLWWSCLAKDKGREKTEAALEGIRPLLQREVARELSIRVTPILSLKFDPTLERAQRLDDIFQKLREERGEDEEDAEDAGEAGEAGAEPEERDATSSS